MFLSYILVAFKACVKYYLYWSEKSVVKKIICIIMWALFCMIFTGCALYDDDDNPTIDINENAAYEGKFYDKNNNDPNKTFFEAMIVNQVEVKKIENTVSIFAELLRE